MNKRYESTLGKVVLYVYKKNYMVYGEVSHLNFTFKTNCLQTAEQMYDWWLERVYIAPVITKDAVKLGLSPSTKVFEL